MLARYLATSQMKRTLRSILTRLGLYFIIRALIKTLTYNRKTWLGFKYLKGQGIEIGALNAPLVTLPWIKVDYLDRLTVPQLRRQYPELGNYPLVPVDILDDGESLKTIKNNSRDFIIAHHFLEHCQDPIGTINHQLKALKKSGILYLAIPDCRFNVDAGIPPTTLNHLINDHQKTPKNSYRHHIYNWAFFVDKKQNRALSNHINRLIKINYSIHFHQWTEKELKEFFAYLQRNLKTPFTLKEFIFNKKEYLVVIQKENHRVKV